jgi:hypothetical protein
LDQVTRPELGQIAAVLHPVAMDHAFLHLHPSYCTPELEAETISFAEQRLSVQGEDGGRRLVIPADQNAALRQLVLQARGYAGQARTVHHCQT